MINPDEAEAESEKPMPVAIATLPTHHQAAEFELEPGKRIIDCLMQIL
jgi:hypothetical protein